MDALDIAYTADQLPGLCTTIGELKRLAELAQGVSAVAEIGCYMGRSTKALSLAAGGRVYAVDTWRGSDEDNEGEKTKTTTPEILYAKFCGNLWDEISNGKVIPLRCDSVEGADILKAQGIRLDVIFLDAGHDYEWVTRDIQAWKPLLRKGGVMVGHDLPHPRMEEALNDYLPGWTASVGMLWEWVNE